MAKDITRREFAKMSAIGVAGVASIAMFGCSSGEKPLKETSSSSTSSSATSGASEGTVDSTIVEGTALEHSTLDTSAPLVFFTQDISPKGLVSVYNALDFVSISPVAVKLSMGEPGGNNYLKPELVADLIHQLDGTIVECNTAYGGKRSTTKDHLKVAEDHGFTAIAKVDIMDSEGTMPIPVEGGKFLKEDIVGVGLTEYPSFVSLAHFKGHAMGGFGGAIKNCSIGIASVAGKLLIHSAGKSSTSWESAPQDDFLASMAEAAKAVSDYLSGSIAYVNVANNISVDCDCDSNPADPDMADIGIFASMDPVAVDQACVDAIYAVPDGKSVINRIESKNGTYVLEYGEQIGLGSRAYRFVELV